MSTQRPNVLLFLTDQQRFDTIAALGNPVIRTPNLDWLARTGTAFTSAYSPSPVCVPARCSMHYGQYPAHSHCYENGSLMPEDRPSFMQQLSEAGYRTHGVGKCHFTPDPAALRGFQTRERQEELVGRLDDDDFMPFLQKAGFAHLCDPHGVRGEMYYVPQVAPMPANLHPTHWVGDRSVAFIEEQVRTKQPWLLFSSFIHPHPPFAPPNPWHKLYRAAMMPLPLQVPDQDSLWLHINRVQNRYKYRDQGLDLNLLRCLKAYYYACISFIDQQVGRILKALESTGQLDRTLIVFTSDHGEHLGDRACFGKRSMHDSCARVPLLARLPGQFGAGTRCDAPASLVDVAPTILRVAGVRPAYKLDGVDMAELAAGRNGRERVFMQHDQAGHASYTTVSRRWKYSYSAPDDREFLFDRRTDPLETRNRAGISFLGNSLAEERQALLEFLRGAGEEAALDGASWRKYPKLPRPEDPDTGLLIQDHAWADLRIPGYTDQAGSQT